MTAERDEQRDARHRAVGEQLRALPARGQHLGLGVEDGDLARETGGVPLRGEVITAFGGLQCALLRSELHVDRLQPRGLVGRLAHCAQHGVVVACNRCVDFSAGTPVFRLQSAGVEHRQVIGDQTPLVVDGVKFYTTPNKGFAPLFDWIGPGETPVRGAVHLPSYPLHENGQVREWKPGSSSPAVTVTLRLLDTVLDPSRPGVLRLPVRHVVHVRAGDAEAELRPGESVSIAGGELRYIGLRTWMGYKVAYDPVVSWLLAAALVAVIALVAHYAIKFRRRV